MYFSEWGNIKLGHISPKFFSPLQGVSVQDLLLVKYKKLRSIRVQTLFSAASPVLGCVPMGF